jgi:hypothetical protein
LLEPLQLRGEAPLVSPGHLHWIAFRGFVLVGQRILRAFMLFALLGTVQFIRFPLRVLVIVSLVRHTLGPFIVHNADLYVRDWGIVCPYIGGHGR